MMGKRFGFIWLNCLALLSVAVPDVGAQQGYEGQAAGGQAAVGDAQMPAELPPFSAGGGYGSQPPAYGGQPAYGQPVGAAPYNGGAQYSQYAPLQAPQNGQYGSFPPAGGGYGGATNYQAPPPYYGQPPSEQFHSGGDQIIAPAGLSLPVSLQTAISTQVAKNGDYIQGTISQNVSFGRGYIPAGTQVVGAVTDSVAGRRLSRSGELSLQFTNLRLPNGQQVPITAHLVGDLGKYHDKGTGNNPVFRGEGGMAKVGQTAIRGGVGAGLGAGLGTAVGAIAGGGHGAGMGAWSGAAIGGGVGVADMFLRKGRDVIIPTGTEMQVQLDQPVDLGGSGAPPQGPPQGYPPPQGYGQNY